MCHANQEWVDVLPVVLLGLRSCYKEDIRASAAELLYGRPLRVPGEFFDHEDMPQNPQYFVEPFRRMMQQIEPSPTAHHTHNKHLYTRIYILARMHS